MHDALTLVKAKKSSSWRTTFKLCVECWRRWRVALISYSWGGLWGKNGCLILPGFCMHYHCSTATKLNLIDEMICWSHFIWKNPEASSAQCQLCIYRCLCNISPRNLEPCFLQTLFFNYQFVLLWAYDFDGWITGVTECSKADGFHFNVAHVAARITLQEKTVVSIQTDPLLLVPKIIAQYLALQYIIAQYG